MRLAKLDPPIDLDHDHVLGPPDAELTLVEYGSYGCPHCHAVHNIIAGLRNRFGERMRYVFRHLPVADSDDALRSAELAEYAAETTGRFWGVHAALMERGPVFSEDDFGRIAREFNLPSGAEHEAALTAARERVREDAESARRSGARVTPTFFINGRRYAGAWDESSLADADVFQQNGRLMVAITLGLVVGKSIGIVAASWLAVRSGIAVKPEAYSWRQLIGAGALGGIGFTMSLFIAGLAFPNAADYAAAKIAIFIASVIAAVVGTIILYPRRHEESEAELAEETDAVGCAI